MGNLTNKLWFTELKVLYLSDLKSVKAINALLNPDWFSLMVVVRGSVHFMQDSSGVTVSEAEVYVVPKMAQVNTLSLPLRICLLSCSLDFALTNKIIRFGSGYMEALIDQRSFVFSLSPGEVRHMISLFRFLKKKISNKHGFFKDEMILLCFNMIVYEYIEMRYKYDGHVLRLHYHNEKIVTRFITLVQQHCAAHHNVRFYADSLYISKGHLGKAVRSILPMSAKHFIEMALISEAYTFLADDTLSITQVAELLHFDSSPSFSGFFKKHTRLTPTQYRLSLQF